MAVDLSVELIQATVQVEQLLGEGKRTVGTGVPDLRSRPPTASRARCWSPPTTCSTKMPGAIATIGFRIENADGSWRYDPEPLKIRDGDQRALDPPSDRDVAVIAINAPPEFAKAAIPHRPGWPADDTFAKYGVGPGDEMLALGYPQGFSANAAGFPILQVRPGGLVPARARSTAFPTFLLDLNVFPGNSGGPVFTERRARAGRRRRGRPESVHRRPDHPAGGAEQPEPGDRHRHRRRVHPRDPGPARPPRRRAGPTTRPPPTRR